MSNKDGCIINVKSGFHILVYPYIVSVVRGMLSVSYMETTQINNTKQFYGSELIDVLNDQLNDIKREFNHALIDNSLPYCILNNMKYFMCNIYSEYPKFQQPKNIEFDVGVDSIDVKIQLQNPIRSIYVDMIVKE